MGSRHGDSASATNPVTKCDFFCLRKLLKRCATTVGTIVSLVGIGFADYGVVLANHSIDSNVRQLSVVISFRMSGAAQIC